MTKLYSRSTRGFYDPAVHRKNIPLDAVEITDDRHRELLEANSKGLDIVPDENGFPQTCAFVMTPEQRKAAMPFCRAVALRRVSEMIERHRDEIDLGTPTTISDDEYKAAVAYRARVRGSVDAVPEMPEFLKAELKVQKHG